MSHSAKVIFINSHPIQYFVPLYQYLNRTGIPTECWYCSDENVKGHFDKQFGTQVTWDIPLLDGYPHRFFPNRSWKPSLYNGFFGLINPGLWRALRSEQKAVVVVHGWNYLTHIMCVLVARAAGHVICLRGESPLNQEVMKSPLNRFLKKIFLQGFLFRWVTFFLFIGKQNREFYNYYRVPAKRLIHVPYAVDNERFQKAANSLDKKNVREKLGIPGNSYVIMSSAKYIAKKRPLDILRAFDQVNHPDKFLMMVGEGELRSEMQAYIDGRGMKNVLLTGFVNQSEIVEYYSAADAFVLASGEGETWGLSVNEAMNFNLPVIVSDTAGCADDLVVSGKSGFKFQSGSIEALTKAINECVIRKDPFESSKVIDDYSYERIRKSLTEIMKASNLV